MTRLRFPVSAFALGLAAGAFALPAFAQEARIEDIQISQAAPDAGGGISILVKLSGQPRSAGATQVGGALVVDIDGITLPALAFDPAGNAMVRHVAVTPPAPGASASSRIRFEGAAFTGASTTIYTDAVLIEARLAEASLPAGASLMAAATPSKAPAVKPVVAAKPAMVPPPAPAPVPAAVKPMPTTPVVAAAMAPIVPAPAAQISSAAPAPHPTDAKSNALESHPISLTSPAAAVQVAAAPKVAGPTPPVAPVVQRKSATTMATLAKLDTNSCAEAETQLKNDAWALGALGNHALCLIDQQKFPEAKNRIDQLAAFSPEDWRVEAGRAALAAQKGDASQAEIGYRNAAQLAPDEATRTAIMQMVAKLMGPAIN
jgi:Flp pilus assembly protein TadD